MDFNSTLCLVFGGFSWLNIFGVLWQTLDVPLAKGTIRKQAYCANCSVEETVSPANPASKGQVAQLIQTLRQAMRKIQLLSAINPAKLVTRLASLNKFDDKTFRSLIAKFAITP